MPMPAGITLRGYQEQAIREISDRLVVDRRVLMVAPTGSGKTMIASALIQRAPHWRRVLWLAHRTELIEQARAHLKRLGLHCGVCCAMYAKHHPDHVDETARERAGRRPERARRALDILDQPA